MTSPSSLSKLSATATGKFVSIGLLILVLLIPLGMVESVIHERHQTYRDASYELTQSWGQEIVISDPILTVPQARNTPKHNGGFLYNIHYEHLLPSSVNITGNIDTQLRKRGIYKVPVYTGDIVMQGVFDLTEELLREQDYKKNVLLQIRLNSQALKKMPEIKWNNQLIPMRARKSAGQQLIFVAEFEDIETLLAGENSFELHLDVSGSYALSFQSAAAENEIDIRSNWDSPSFFGNNLPLAHEITDAGFEAKWKSSHFFSELGHTTSYEMEPSWLLNQSGYGVRFIETVDTYQQVTRVIKYAILFLMLIFAVYFLHETLGRVLLHPIQYLFIGFALCVFYLLLLSMAEHMNFNLAYLISALASALLIAFYSMSILNSRVHGLFIFIKLTALYGFLLMIIKSEDFALLIGSVGLFAILALIMFFTRNYDWRKSVTMNPGD